MTNEAALKKKTKAIHEALLKVYGTPKWTKLDGVSELVSTILSQNTNDGNRDLAYSRLRARFATWEQVRDAKTDAVIDAIKPAGLASSASTALAQRRPPSCFFFATTCRRFRWTRMCTA